MPCLLHLLLTLLLRRRHWLLLSRRLHPRSGNLYIFLVFVLLIIIIWDVSVQDTHVTLDTGRPLLLTRIVTSSSLFYHLRGLACTCAEV